jgi:hypothetical protein
MYRYRCFVLFALLLTALAWGNAAHGQQISGAIFTTNDLCDGTDLNIYMKNKDVYLDGGPRKEGSAGLPDGYYYVQVTEPNGTLLGSSYDETPVHVVDGSFEICYQLWDIVYKASNDHVKGYDSTSNSGGEYKVWVSMDPDFTLSLTKTDNFKVKTKGQVPPEQTDIHVLKFYDLDGQGDNDGENNGEPLISGWHFELYEIIDDTRIPVACDLTASGEVLFMVDRDGKTYEVCEVFPEYSDGEWVNTTPDCVQFTASVASVEIEFGNVCLEERYGLGRTPGFWQSCNNPEGEGVVACDLLSDEDCDPAWRKLLNDLCLVNPDGSELVISEESDFEIAFDELDDWITGNGAEGNMAYILSRQLAALALNAECGFFPGTVYVDCGDGSQSVHSLIDEADSLLCAAPYTPGNDEDAAEIRAMQEEVKNCIDKINNNIIPVLVPADEPCWFMPVECDF